MSTSRRRILAARAIAILADAVQLGLMPMFIEGAASPLDDVLDAVVGATMIALVGWHWAFLPAFLTELVPFADVAPTWTIAVMIATRRREPASIQPTESSPGTTDHRTLPEALPGAQRSTRNEDPPV